MRIAITITDEFADPTALLEFSARLRVLAAMPADMFARLAANIPAYNSAPQPPGVAETPAVVTAPTVAAADSVPPVVEMVNSAFAAAPSEVAPRGKRGRPAKVETQEPATPLEPPKASTVGAMGVSTAPAAPMQIDVAAAIKAGEAQSIAEQDFKVAVLPFVQVSLDEYRRVLGSFGFALAKDVTPEKRAAVLEKLATTIKLPLPVAAAA